MHDVLEQFAPAVDQTELDGTGTDVDRERGPEFRGDRMGHWRIVLSTSRNVNSSATATWIMSKRERDGFAVARGSLTRCEYWFWVPDLAELVRCLPLSSPCGVAWSWTESLAAWRCFRLTSFEDWRLVSSRFSSHVRICAS